ncbi:MAG: HIT family protein [Ignavibacteriales bacterium]|nr:MAG: HIT family protein [Ignavibacteriales bacterium]
MKCIFCEIVNGNSPAEIIYENKSALAFLDINPMNFGHTLVIPKNHYSDFTSIPGEEISEVIYAVQKISAAVRKSLGADGYNIVSNNGEAAGQSVFHFHFHIIPRTYSDIKVKFNLKKYQGSSIKEYADKIKKELDIYGEKK